MRYPRGRGRRCGMRYPRGRRRLGHGQDTLEVDGRGTVVRWLMILFLTALDIREAVTPEDFIKLVLEWNAGSKYEENIVKGIDWHGERTVRYGDSKLWLEFVEYAQENILAVRHEKTTEDGVVWDSDFVMNFENHRLTIQLDRTYSEEALVMGAYFSTPHFISLLIERGFLADDGDLPVLRTPIEVTDSRFSERSEFGDNSSSGSLVWYFGQAPVVFNNIISRAKQPLLGKYEFGKILSTFGFRDPYIQAETGVNWKTYFYTYGIVLIKLNRLNNAKIYFNKVLESVDGFLLPNDPWIININDLVKICNTKKIK